MLSFPLGCCTRASWCFCVFALFCVVRVDTSKLTMTDTSFHPCCFNDTSFLLQHGFDPRMWDDATRRAFVNNIHRRCPSSQCLCNEAFVTNSLVNNESVCEECPDDSKTQQHLLYSTPTHPTSTPDNPLDSKTRERQHKTTTKQYETNLISTRQDRTKSTPTQPASLGISRCPTMHGMLGSIAVCEIDEWVPCFTIDLTDGLADALGKERQYSNGEAYYHTEWPIVTGQVRSILYNK